MITNNIIRFLQNEETVILNRLGRFSKKTVPSVVDGDMILPPKVILEFEYLEDGSGFPVIEKISQWESMSLLDVDEKVSKWVTDLKTSIQNNKSVSFENFGTFFLNDSQTICFESDLNKELNAEYLGMSAVPLSKSDHLKKASAVDLTLKENTEPDPISELEDEPVVEVIPEPIPDVEDEPVVQVIPEPIPEVEVEPILEIIPEPIIEKVFEEECGLEDSKIKRGSKWGTLIFIFVILGAIALLALLFKDPILNFYNTKIKKFNIELPLEQQASTFETHNPEFITNEAEEILDPNLQQETVGESAPDQTIEPQIIPISTSKNVYPMIPMEQGKFYVIAGSFGKESDAVKHIKDKKLGHYNPILITGQSRVRVCIGTFSTEDEALNFAKQNDKTYWVLK